MLISCIKIKKNPDQGYAYSSFPIPKKFSISRMWEWQDFGILLPECKLLAINSFGNLAFLCSIRLFRHEIASVVILPPSQWRRLVGVERRVGYWRRRRQYPTLLLDNQYSRHCGSPPNFLGTMWKWQNSTKQFIICLWKNCGKGQDADPSPLPLPGW